MPAFSRRSLPPGPRNYWGPLTVRHAYQLWRNPIQYVSRLTQRYGEIFTFRLFTRRAFVINSPDGVQQVLIDHADSFCKQRRQMRILSRVFRQGLIVSDGELWKQQRQIVQRAFNRTNMSRYVSICVDETNHCTDRWHDGMRLNLSPQVASILVATMGRIFFGTKFSGLQKELLSAVRQVSQSVIDEIEIIIPWIQRLPTKWSHERQQAQRRLAELVDELIAKRIGDNDPASEDFIALLLRESPASQRGNAQPLAQVRDEVLTMLVAANHTITAAAEWVFKAVTENEGVLQAIQEELERVLQGRPVTWEDHVHLPYTQAVVRETLRMYPAAWSLFVREALQDVEVQGYRIRKGEWVFIYPILLHHNPRVFSEPHKFDPTRFLGEATNGSFRYAYIPYGIGSHTCIGANLSHAILTTLLTTVLQKFTLMDTAPSAPDAIHRDVAMRPAVGVPVCVRLRSATTTQYNPLDTFA